LGDAAITYEAPRPAAVVHVARTFAARRERVFRAWTEPEAVRQWFGRGSNHSVELDLRVGGDYRITFRMPITGRKAHVGGTFLEVTPPERLVYTFAWEGVPIPTFGMGESKVIVEFRDLGAETEVRLTHELLDRRRLRSFHGWGWRRSMDNLERLL
jgi:uncharacterized protein YndB with AHSA1/START domain